MTTAAAGDCTPGRAPATGRTVTTIRPLLSPRQLSPAQLLQLAILEDALRVIRTRGRAWKRPRARARYVAEAEAWIASDDYHPADPLSVIAVCESLGLSLAGLRASLARASAEPGWHSDAKRGKRRVPR